MPKKEEIDAIVDWCEQTKKERNAIFVLERNPFSLKFEWTRNLINIEIDRPLTLASKSSLVYDSRTKRLYQYIGYQWVAINVLKKE